VAFLALSVVGFGNVKQLFFPNSSMTKFMIDYWAPVGTRIEQVTADLELAEAKLLADERVTGVASYIGAGPPRFYLPVEPEKPYSSYAQLVVNVRDFRGISDIIVEFDRWFRDNFPQASVLMRPFGVGPGMTWKFDVRIIGPGDADGATLRTLAGEVENILEANPLAGFVRTDWRQRVQKIVPAYNQEQGRWAAVTREDVANATKRAFDGRAIGLYREGDDLLPIVMRHVEEERRNVGGLDVIQVRPALSTNAVPLSQVTDGVAPQWEDPLIWRRDRRRTIKVQSNPIPGVTLPTLRASLVEQVEAVEFPPGYKLEWGGEFESSRDSQASLIPGIVPALAIMVLIIVMLFNAYRPPLVIILTIPFALIGITSGLLAFNSPFGFLALLGAMSLAGMMIKNAIVLLDEININLADGRSRYTSVLEAALSRLRPVVLAAATTVLGVAPLLQDVFWVGLAVTVMAGLTFGTVLTMVLVPVLYATVYGLKEEEA
jgi:multidrug efflux pump subunit AcrB